MRVGRRWQLPLVHLLRGQQTFFSSLRKMMRIWMMVAIVHHMMMIVALPVTTVTAPPKSLSKINFEILAKNARHAMYSNPRTWMHLKRTLVQRYMHVHKGTEKCQGVEKWEMDCIEKDEMEGRPSQTISLPSSQLQMRLSMTSFDYNHHHNHDLHV